jgi:serpin B
MSAFPTFQTNAATEAQCRFGLNLVRLAAASTTSGNVAVSPIGVLAAFALALSGACGSTRVELAAVLFGPSNNIERAEAAFAGWLHEVLSLYQKHKEGDELTLVTSLWTDQRFRLLDEFIRRAQTLYGAQANSLDFTKPRAASLINKWVKEHTRGRISEIISAGDLMGSPPPSMVLLNAVYFQAKWLNEFDPEHTYSEWFRQATGARQKARFMHQVSGDIGYQAGLGWRAVSLPYSGYPRRYAMRIFVPDEPDGLPAFLSSLDATTWTQWHNNFSSQQVEVDLALPRFRVEWSQNVGPLLQQMGLADALHAGANFSGMGFREEDGGGFIGAVLHKTFLNVDEEGTEAAAVTAMMWMAGGVSEPEPKPRVVLKVDSPFFYAIVDQDDGTILFAGTVSKLVQD